MTLDPAALDRIFRTARTFRAWDGQLRQPIIIAGPDLPVSMSPQEGFLHEHAEVDTLGIDEPETKCKMQ
jgi:hypothetical protein